MSARNVGVVAVVLASIGLVVSIVGSQRGLVAEQPTRAQPNETIDKLVVDYAFQTMERLAAQAVSACGYDLNSQEADVTARVRVGKGSVITLNDVKFAQAGWSSERLRCVTAQFEGHQRDPKADGVRMSLPEGGEYEVDAHLAFQAPTLQYAD
ncbi:MAG: hypothetical protein INH41_22110 [Myxococcaceae bacterium]|jgi:hypothetical protein|nr:hypothetical protein [Myxococcaceae bacterium]MCA3015090.1 hypothetical protein [Myxococcaceae bacterium]